MSPEDKTALLGLLGQAVTGGWTLKRACRVLGLDERRARRWRDRAADGGLEDRRGGGHPVHGVTPEEVTEILALAQEWGEFDGSHCKLAHRGSYTGRVWVSPSTVFRVLLEHGRVLAHRPAREPLPARAWPDWVQYQPNQVQAFLELHVQAFEWFGGVFSKIRFDNLKSAVKKVLRGRRRIESDRFVALRSHYLFASQFTTPGLEGAHEKGGVEGEVGRCRRNHLVPVPEVADLAELNALLLVGCERDLGRRIDGRPVTVREAWATERGGPGGSRARGRGVRRRG